ncbi:MAG TPA: right-handed parallel beta-helix repeat-containing protein [Gemmatimonadales bacterium]|nr:right-handed parallel beta-helix repeat-containing protein [Gemmatimonadales bacterium]
MKGLSFVIAMSLAAINAVADTSGTLTITSNTTLTENHNGSIWIEADNVTLDCAGHTITGPGESPYNSGVLVLSYSGVTVKNCLVTSFDQGIQVADSVGVTAANNKSFDNPGNGNVPCSVEN